MARACHAEAVPLDARIEITTLIQLTDPSFLKWIDAFRAGSALRATIRFSIWYQSFLSWLGSFSPGPFILCSLYVFLPENPGYERRSDAPIKIVRGSWQTSSHVAPCKWKPRGGGTVCYLFNKTRSGRATGRDVAPEEAIAVVHRLSVRRYLTQLKEKVEFPIKSVDICPR